LNYFHTLRLLLSTRCSGRGRQPPLTGSDSVLWRHSRTLGKTTHGKDIAANLKQLGVQTMILQQLLGIELPIIQAPMAGVQGSALAVAVSNAGGLCSLPCAMLSLDAIRHELAAIKTQTDKPFNINFFCHVPPEPSAEREAVWRAALSPYYKEYGINVDTIPAGPGRAPFSSEAADVLEEFKPAVVSFHFGLPSEGLLARVKAWGAKILSSATTIEEARWLEAHGVDAIIAQGLEAGGHRGMFLSEDLSTQVGLFALLPQIVRAVKLPVIAAGGIAEAKGVAAAMALGAAGVQIGTAYLLCPEATTSAVHRAALKSEAARHTALTNLFTGRPARGIVNRIMTELGPISTATPAFPLATAAITPLRAKAESRSSADFSPLWCGQNASGCNEVPAAELTRALAADL
jgi:nitronate monooxygenase